MKSKRRTKRRNRRTKRRGGATTDKREKNINLLSSHYDSDKDDPTYFVDSVYDEYFHIYTQLKLGPNEIENRLRGLFMLMKMNHPEIEINIKNTNDDATFNTIREKFVLEYVKPDVDMLTKKGFRR